MFTGIIEATAKIMVIRGSKTCTEFTIERPEHFTDIAIGSSISVSGVCLTVVAFDLTSMNFNVIEETLKKSTVGNLKKDDRVNLERAMKADGRFDGHIVQGHIEGVGTVVANAGKALTIEMPHELMSAIILKGSISIDGVSLTIAEIKENLITVALIPHTLENTMLGTLKKGDSVNIETDIIRRYV